MVRKQIVNININFNGEIDILLKDLDLKKLFPDEDDPSTISESESKIVSRPELSTIEISKSTDVQSTELNQSNDSGMEFFEEDRRQNIPLEKDVKKKFEGESKSFIGTVPKKGEDIDSLVDYYNEQQEHLGEREIELKSDFADWKEEATREIEVQNLELAKKQDLIFSLEEKNAKLHEDLKSKLDEYERQTSQLKVEKDKLKFREQEIEKKMEDYNEKDIKFNARLKEIESESLIIESERAKLMEEKQKLAIKVAEFEERVKEEVNQELAREFHTTKSELNDSWARLHSEEEKLSEVYNDICEAKNTFKEKFLVQLEEINLEREKLAEEWERVKDLRKGLENDRNNFGTRIDTEELRIVEIMDGHVKGKLEDNMLADLESRLRDEISEQFAREHEESKAQLEKEWGKLRNEQDKLAKKQKSILQKRRGKSKNKIDSRLKNLKGLFTKYKHKKAEFEALEAEFQAKEEQRLQELAYEEQRKHELNDMAKGLEEQQKELDKERERLSEEWDYVDKVKEKLKQENEKSTQSRAVDPKTENPKKDETGTELQDMSSDELTKELEDLQVELKKEWTELREQHERLKEAKNVFSKARSSFEQFQERRKMKLDKVPIANLGLDKLQ
jgi:chromosome segregation ATPase